MKEHVVFEGKLAIYPASVKELGILTRDNLSWLNKGVKQQLNLSDVVGTSLVDYGQERQPCLSISAYPQKHSLFSKKQHRLLQEYRFTCADIASRSQWQKAIDNTLIGRSIDADIQPRHLQILINPNSGRGKAIKIFARVRPLFDRANLSYSVTKTSSAADTQCLAYSLNLKKVDGLIIVGGDGTIHDAIAGLMSRPDNDAAINLPIGVIPGGTGNGLCRSLLESAGESYDPVNAAFVIAKGRQQSFDLALVRQTNRRYYSFLSLAWGLISDVDIESEKIRFFGALRFDLYALFLMCVKRTYKGRFSFVTHPDCQLWMKNSDLSCQVIEDDFVFIWAMNTPWAAHDMNVTPHAKLNDGAIDVLIMRQGTPRLEILQALLLCGRGKHLHLPHLEYYKVSSFKLEPLSDRGIFVVDGEPVDYSTIEIEVQPNAAYINC